MANKRVIGLASIAILTIAIVFLYLQLKPSALDENQLIRLQRTLENGFLIQGIIDEYFKRNHSYPDLLELCRLIQSLTRGNPPEYISLVAVSTVTTSHSGTGGWTYLPESGRIIINIDKALPISTDGKLYINLSGIIFARNESLPIKGEWPEAEKANLGRKLMEESSGFLNVATELGNDFPWAKK